MKFSQNKVSLEAERIQASAIIKGVTSKEVHATNVGNKLGSSKEIICSATAFGQFSVMPGASEYVHGGLRNCLAISSPSRNGVAPSSPHKIRVDV